jgi:hypothetical protein
MRAPFFICCVFCLILTGVVTAGAVTIPKDTAVVIRTLDPIDSKTADVAQNFRCTLDAPITADGKELAAKGADCVLRIVEAKKAGVFRGKNELKLVVSQIRVGDDLLDVDSEPVAVTGDSKGASTAKRAGLLGGLGAAIGGMSGGMKGAAIGAGAGAAAGAASSALTEGPEIKVKVETVLKFMIH